MTHPTDDEIMELAGAWFHTGENQKRDDGYYYRSLGTPSNVRGSDLIEFARALLAEQARTEPVAWVYWHPSDTTHDGPDTLHKKAVSRFTDDTRKAMMAKGWLFEPLYPASTAAQPLKAEQAKDAAEDAELLEWLEEKHYALHPIKEDQGDDTYTLWWQVTDKDKSISGHPLGNIRAAIRAARAAERKA
jgi:hypothetical protein